MALSLGCNQNLSSIFGLVKALTLRSNEFSSNGFHLFVDGNITASSKEISTYEMQQQEHLNTVHPPHSLESLLPLQKAMLCITISAETNWAWSIPDVCRGHFRVQVNT